MVWSMLDASAAASWLHDKLESVVPVVVKDVDSSLGEQFSRQTEQWSNKHHVLPLWSLLVVGAL